MPLGTALESEVNPDHSIQKDLYCRFKPNTTLLEVNDSYCRMFNMERKDLIGKKFIELIPEDKREKVLSNVTKAIETGEQAVYEHVTETSCGNEVFVRWAGSPIFNNEGEIVELEAIGIDITRAGLAKKNNNKSLKAILEKPAGMEMKRTIEDELEKELDICSKFVTNSYIIYSLDVNGNETAQDIIKTFIANSYKLNHKAAYIYPEIDDVKKVYHKFYTGELGGSLEYFLEIEESLFKQGVVYEISKDLYTTTLNQKYNKDAVSSVYKDIYVNLNNANGHELVLVDYKIDNVGRVNSEFDTMFFAVSKRINRVDQVLPDWVNGLAYDCEKEMLDTFNFM